MQLNKLYEILKKQSNSCMREKPKTKLTVNFQESCARLSCPYNILDHTLIAAIIRLSYILNGQITTINNAYTFIAIQV